MRSYKVIVSNDAVNDLDAIADYIAHRYKSTSGHNFVNRILGQLESLSHSADLSNQSFLCSEANPPLGKDNEHHTPSLDCHIPY